MGGPGTAAGLFSYRKSWVSLFARSTTFSASLSTRCLYSLCWIVRTSINCCETLPSWAASSGHSSPSRYFLFTPLCEAPRLLPIFRGVALSMKIFSLHFSNTYSLGWYLRFLVASLCVSYPSDIACLLPMCAGTSLLPSFFSDFDVFSISIFRVAAPFLVVNCDLSEFVHISFRNVLLSSVAEGQKHLPISFGRVHSISVCNLCFNIESLPVSSFDS